MLRRPPSVAASRSIPTSRSRPDWRFAWSSIGRFARPRRGAIDRRLARCSDQNSGPYDLQPPGRRSGDLTGADERDEPLDLLVDSTGVKIYGEGEWLNQKHGVRSCRQWRKLHLGVDADTHEIVAVELTPEDVGGVSAVPDLLEQIKGPVGSITGDGAYDGKTVYDAVAIRHPEAAIIIPPRSTAVASETAATPRGRHLQTIARYRRISWQKTSGYSRRSLGETARYR